MANVKLEDIFSSMIGAKGAGHAPLSATTIIKDLDKIGSELGVESGKIIAAFNDTAKHNVEMWSKAKGLVTDAVTGNFSGAMKTLSSFSDSMNETLLNSIISMGKVGGEIIGVGLDVITYANVEASKARSGIEGAMHMITDSIVAPLQDMKGSFGKFGRMLGSVLNNAISDVTFIYRDYLTRAKTAQLAQAQLGLGETGTVAREMRVFMDRLGREEAQRWAGELIKIGITEDAGALRDALQTGLTMQMDPGEVAGMMNELLAVTNNSTEASDTLQKNFRMMQSAAEGTNLPVRTLAKFVQDATVNARFMNVDLQSVGGVMQTLANNADKLKSIGLDLRLDGGKILSDITNASDKANDALHAFYGTEGGITGSAIEGWVRSKFGTQFAETLEKTTGGFTAEGGRKGDMMIQRLEVMKQTMERASAGAKTDAEKLFLEYKAAKDIFSMGEEATRALLMTKFEDLGSIVNKPEVAGEFESTNSLLGKLRSENSIRENIQRSLAKTSLNQLQLMTEQLARLDILALAASGEDTEKIEEAVKELNKRSLDNAKTMAAGMLEITSEVKKVLPSSLKKSMPSLEGLDKLTSDIKKRVESESSNWTWVSNIFSSGEEEEVKKRQSGGLALKDSMYLVGEKGPELFSPNVSGTIFDAEKTNTLITTKNTGNQINLNLTINTGLMSRGEFKRVLESEILDTIY